MIISRTVSLPELLWTVWCSVGLLYLLRLFWSGIEDWKWVIANRMGGLREYAAINSVLTFGTMTLTQLVFVLAGIVAMLLPAPHGEVTPLTYVLTGLFMFGSAAKSILAMFIYMRKETLVTKVESGEWKLANEERE